MDLVMARFELDELARDREASVISWVRWLHLGSSSDATSSKESFSHQLSRAHPALTPKLGIMN